MKKILLAILAMVFSAQLIFAQEKNNVTVPDPTVDDYVPLTLKLNPDGSKYIRFIMWGQFWLTGAKNTHGDFMVNANLRRARLLAYAQVSPRFMILMHFGLNSLNDATMDPTGNRTNGPQLFLHGAWSEFTVVQKKFYVGAGLHYWNGISRLTNSSTLNFLTLDNYRRAWALLGLTDQFARHLGVYAKGELGRFAYRVSANSPLINSLDVARIPTDTIRTPTTLYTSKYEYSSNKIVDLNAANWSYQGYFEYMFFDIESDKLPYKVGSYLGKKKVLNIGAGFFFHPDGSLTYNPDSVFIQNNVSHFAFDVFYDSPVGKGAITAYAAFYLYDYGPNYTLGQTYGTGNSFLMEFGYLIPQFSKKISLQPYAAFNTVSFEAFQNPGNSLRTGINMFLDGHHAKFTLEYTTTQDMYMDAAGKPAGNNSIILQAQVFL